MKFSDFNWDGIDSFVSSMARPYQQYSCSTACWFALVWSTITKQDAIVIGACLTTCGGLAGWSANLRSTDKKTQASVEIAKITPSDNQVTAEVKS